MRALRAASPKDSCAHELTAKPQSSSALASHTGTIRLTIGSPFETPPNMEIEPILPRLWRLSIRKLPQETSGLRRFQATPKGISSPGRLLVGGYRKHNYELSAMLAADDLDAAAIARNDSMDQRQAQTGAMVFSGEKRDKNFFQLLFGDAAAIVFNADSHLRILLLGRDPHHGALAGTRSLGTVA